MSLRTIAHLCRSRRNLFLGSSDLERMQILKLRKMLTFAYNNVPFYHEKLKKVGLKPDDIQTLDDLGKVPLTTKTDIQNTPLKNMVTGNVEVDKCVKNRTSGSTGISLTTLAGKETDDFDQTMWLRAYFLNGMHLRDKRVVFRDLTAHPELLTHKSWVGRFGIMRRKYVSIFDDSRTQTKILAEEKPGIIESYPSSLAIIADLHSDDIVNVRPRLVFTLAEFLDRRSRELITTAFQTELFDYYGSAEIGLMSWECKRHWGYHINADNVIMEFINENGETLEPGKTGEIVCTNLYNYEMPMIRYKHGDIGTTIVENCTCGVRLPLMKIVGGRKDDFLRTTDGRAVPPTVFFPFPFEDFEKIRQFRVIQETRNKLRIQLVVKQSFDTCLFEKARKKIQRVFGQDMEVEFEILEHLARDRSGKLRKIISRI